MPNAAPDLHRTPPMAKARITLPIEGMSCASCAITVQQALAAQPGVAAASVNYATGRASVDYDDAGAGIGHMVRAVRNAGYDCGLASVTIAVVDLHYAPSVAPLEKALAQVPGVVKAVANQALETASVEYVPGVTTAQDLEGAVRAAGFSVAEPIPSEDPEERERVARAFEVRALTWKFALAAVVAVIAMLGGMILMADRPLDTFHRFDLLGRVLMPVSERLRDLVQGRWPLDSDWIRRVLGLLTIPVMVWSGGQFYRATWSGFRHRTADMNTLIAVGTGAVFLQAGLPADVYYEAVSAIIALILFGRLLEARAKGQTSAAIRKLAGLRPKTARVRRGTAESDVAIEAVVVDDFVIIRPGERVPVDGIVTEGVSSVDE